MSEPKQYALAAFASALEPWIVALKSFKDQLGLMPDLSQALENRDNSVTMRRKLIIENLPNGASEQCQNFIATIIENGDLRNFSTILAWLESIAADGPNVNMVSVTTSYLLNAEEKQHFLEKLKGIHGDDISVLFSVDEDIVGGVVVTVGDSVVDASIKTRVESLANSLVSS